METATNPEAQKIPEDILEEARELVRGAEVLPDGVNGLAQKIFEARKEGRKLRVKLGVDPTSTDLHLGHAVVFRKLRRFQEFGHQIVLIIGGFTAQIGDPSGRDKTRPPLSSADVDRNAQTYINQMGLILDMKLTEVTNNADWLAPFDFTKVLQLASHATVNQMLAKEAFGERMEKQLPIALHELFYPLLQAYDSVAIKCDIELGGTDQRFNILQGRELQPRYGLKPQLGMFLPLLEGTDGVQKMSKSYGNYISLKDEPSDMFGKCMRIPDELIVKYFELTTTFSGTEIDAISEALKNGANPKDMKEKLGHQIVKQYHGEEAAEHALNEWKRVHSEKQLPELEEMPLHLVAESSLPLRKILVDTKMAASGGNAKQLMAEGAIRLNGEQVKDPNYIVELKSDVDLVLQKGRRQFARLRLST
ncbi:MAG: tyrosine--tRNA ligase [Candidatus Obscuribacterales bacterium]|nr:tyrosine--tRNA ligase [Candidatus Obscuribacterales bacterium]